MRRRHAILVIAAAVSLTAASYAVAKPTPAQSPAADTPAAGAAQTPGQPLGLVLAGLKQDGNGPCGTPVPARRSRPRAVLHAWS